MQNLMPIAQSSIVSRSSSINSRVKRILFSKDPPYSSVRLLWKRWRKKFGKVARPLRIVIRSKPAARARFAASTCSLRAC